MAMTKITKRINKKFKLIDNLMSYFRRVLEELYQEEENLRVERADEFVRHNKSINEIEEQQQKVKDMKSTIERFL